MTKKQKRSSRKRMHNLPRQRQGGLTSYEFYIHEGKKIIFVKEKNKYAISSVLVTSA